MKNEIAIALKSLSEKADQPVTSEDALLRAETGVEYAQASVAFNKRLKSSALRRTKRQWRQA